MPMLIFSLHRRTKSGSQAALVSQIQVRQCKQHMKFCGLLSSTFISRLAITEKSLYNAENMLDLGANGGFFSLPPLNLSL